jgi:hypothetical protein
VCTVRLYGADALGEPNRVAIRGPTLTKLEPALCGMRELFETV